jgi:hypothetical protein
MWGIESLNQVRKPASGGARTCGKGAVCAQDALFSKCVSIWSMIALSSIAAITLAVAPQSRHLSTSMTGRPHLRGPVEDPLESLCLYALWVQLMAT